jgi:hypothetical protein
VPWTVDTDGGGGVDDAASQFVWATPLVQCDCSGNLPAASRHDGLGPPFPSCAGECLQPGIGQIDPVGFGQTLFGFYAHVIQAVTGVRDGLPTCNATGLTPPPPGSGGAACAYPDLGVRDTRHAFFVEPSALRNELDFAPEGATPFTSYPNVVYAPHVYTGSFTIWSPPSFEVRRDSVAGQGSSYKPVPSPLDSP